MVGDSETEVFWTKLLCTEPCESAPALPNTTDD